MNSVSQNHIFGEHLSSKISCFLEEFHVGKILKACNAYKVRGFSVSNVFKVAFENVFRNKSFYQQEKMGSSVIPFAKDTCSAGHVPRMWNCLPRCLTTSSTSIREVFAC